MEELWQLYDEQGVPLKSKGCTKAQAFSRGLLHGAAHVWIWRVKNGTTEVLLQKRASSKPTWPNCFDISAAGHIRLDETPLDAALREIKEEVSLDVAKDDPKLFNVHRAYLEAPNGALENEFQWLYSLELAGDVSFSLLASEVESLTWIPLSQFANECMSSQYVPHTKLYYDTVVVAIEAALQSQD